MLFSAKQLHSFLTSEDGRYYRTNALSLIRLGHERRIPTLRECGAILHTARSLLVSRRADPILDAGLGKWIRPWEAVPALKTFTAPEGDYSVGIEVEFGFRSETSASFIANVIKNWRNITMDSEGGPHGIEVTFPPMLYSKFGPTSAPCRYLKLLEKYRTEHVHLHSPGRCIGTHVNLSYAGYSSGEGEFYRRLQKVNGYLDTRNGYMFAAYREEGETALNIVEQERYFGREPYSSLNTQPTHVEFKLFNSVTDWKALRRYVNISVALLELLRSSTPINRETVVDALELGYNKA